MPPPTDSAGEFTPCPAGSHAAVCCRLIDLGTQETHYQGQARRQRKVYIEFAVPGEPMEDGRPHTIGNRYTFSSSPKSTLRQHLEAWRGRRFSDDEIAGFDLRNVLGQAALINVTHTERSGKTYADIASLSPIPRSMPAPRLDEPAVYLSLEPGEFDPQTFAGLSERLQIIIGQSPEYQRLLAAGQHAPAPAATGPAAAGGKHAAPATEPAPAAAEVAAPDGWGAADDDEIPF